MIIMRNSFIISSTSKPIPSIFFIFGLPVWGESILINMGRGGLNYVRAVQASIKNFPPIAKSDFHGRNESHKGKD